MKVAVFGLGYVGSVTSACLAGLGHGVVGVDAWPAKVRAVNSGEPPVLEPGLRELLSVQVSSGRLSATTDGAAAVRETDVSLIAVGTPSAANGSVSLDAVSRVAETIGLAMRESRGRHTVVVRSTTPPGTSEDVVIPTLEASSGLGAGVDFGFTVNPEFLREGTAISDFHSASKTVIGEVDEESGQLVEELYRALDAPVIRLTVRGAEMAKYVDNAFHAVKITFANEIGALCREFGLDPSDVLESFFVDTRLNISRSYLQPGFAFGGSCLPKDLRALLHAANRRDVSVPMLRSILLSNEECITRAVRKITEHGRCRVGLFGLAFKAGTDDLRESPYVEVAERLLGKGYSLRIYDPAVAGARLMGSNREYIEARIPHLADLVSSSAPDVARYADLCVIGSSRDITGADLSAMTDGPVVDLGALPQSLERGETSRMMSGAFG